MYRLTGYSSRGWQEKHGTARGRTALETRRLTVEIEGQAALRLHDTMRSRINLGMLNAQFNSFQNLVSKQLQRHEVPGSAAKLQNGPTLTLDSLDTGKLAQRLHKGHRATLRVCRGRLCFWLKAPCKRPSLLSQNHTTNLNIVTLTCW